MIIVIRYILECEGFFMSIVTSIGFFDAAIVIL